MSDNNQLAVLMNNSNMPAFAQSGAGAELNKEATAGTGGESINRISLKQSRFRLIVGGEQVSVIPDPFMDVVIVRANPGVSRAYYTRKYDPNAEDQTPDCYSSNGVVPDADVERPQCATCAQCPHSQWGSRINDQGNKVKACAEVKRVAIVPASNVEAPMFQIAVPAASLKPFGTYVRMLNQASPAIPYNGIVTRVSFDVTSDFPKLTFEPKAWVTDQQYAVIKERYDSEEAKRVATITPVPDAQTLAQMESQQTQAAHQQPQQTQPQQTQPTQQTQATQAEPQQPQQAQAQEQAAGAWGAATQAAQQTQPTQQTQAAQAEPQQPQQAQEQEQAAGAWGAATQAAQQPQQPQQPQQTQPTQQAEPQQAQGGDAFAQSGWGQPTSNANPPEQQHQEANAQVVEGDDIDAIFGGGFDDAK